MNQLIGELFELYLSRSDLRPASIRFKKKAMNYFVEWFGNMPAGGVNMAMAEDYRTLLAKGRSKRSANGYLANFKPFWQWLFRHGRIPQNPFCGVNLFKITESKRKTFAANELSRLISLSSRLWRLRMCCGLLGMRRGEMLNVQVRDINLSGPHPHILLCPKNQSNNSWPWQLKNHSERMVALPEVMRFSGITVELHRDYVRLMEDLPPEQPYIHLEPKYYKKLIGWQQAGTLTDKHISDPTGNFQRSFRHLQRKAAIEPPKRYHELRAAFATKMIAKNGLERAADALGHSSVEITRRYDRRTQESLVAEIGQLTENCYQT